MMYRVSQLALLFTLAVTGLAQIPSIQPFSVTGSLDAYVPQSRYKPNANTSQL
jgi:hypothetical protein